MKNNIREILGTLLIIAVMFLIGYLITKI